MDKENMNQTRNGFKQTRTGKGQSLVEVMAGFMVFIPLAFLAVDVVGVTSASQSNEQLAESIARVAANQGSQAMAQRAAEDAAQNYQVNNTITEVTVEQVKYDVGLGQVSITTAMNFKLPIPMPGYSMMVLRSNAVQPIVATPAPL
jgi:Flp pilus assembly protein TadG